MKNNLKICFFGTYDKKYSSNKIILDGLRQNNVDVLEINKNIRITNLNSEKHLSINSLLNRLLIKFSLIPLSLKNIKAIKSCDIMFVGYPGHVDLLFAYIIAKIFKIKLVFYPLIILYITFTEDVMLFSKSSWKAKILKLYEKLIYKLPDLIIADIPFQKKIFTNEFNVPDYKIEEMPIGADDKIYKFAPKEKDNYFNVVYYGLYSPLHGVEYIIQAANILKNNKHIRFIMVGSGQTYEQNFLLAQKLKLNNMIFLPDATEQNSEKILRQADIFLGLLQDSPSVHRVLPNKLYQGLALGKTVITADTEATRKIFKHKENIYLCKPADPKDLSLAIEVLSSNQNLCKKIAQNGYLLYQNNFTPKAIGNLLINHFNKYIF